MGQLITIPLIAQMCHQANKNFCELLGDMSQVDWEEAPLWQKESALAGVKAHIDSGLTMTPEDSHESWSRAKYADGWRYGDVKDADAKTHPCLLPYSDLPPTQRLKDHLFRATVHAMVPFLN